VTPITMPCARPFWTTVPVFASASMPCAPNAAAVPSRAARRSPARSVSVVSRRHPVDPGTPATRVIIVNSSRGVARTPSRPSAAAASGIDGSDGGRPSLTSAASNAERESREAIVAKYTLHECASASDASSGR
jgi:hypothetical protein